MYSLLSFEILDRIADNPAPTRASVFETNGFCSPMPWGVAKLYIIGLITYGITLTIEGVTEGSG